MTALEAQGKAAQLVRQLRALNANFIATVDAIRTTLDDLDKLKPLLSPPAEAEIRAAENAAGDQAGAALRNLLNPADEPA